MAQTIKIGVEFFDAQESAKALLDQLRKEAGRFKAGTTISDALVGDIKSLEGIIKKLDSSLAKGFNSHSDVNKVVNDFNQITRIYEHVASTIEKTKFQDLNLNFDDFSHLAKDLSQATAELAKFKSQKEKVEQTTVQDLLGKTNKNLSLFSADQLSTSSTTIWSKLTQDLEKYKNSLSDAEQRTQALQNTYNAATKAANTGNQVYKRDNDILSLIGESPKNQADMKTIRGSFIQDIQASLKLDDNKMNLSKAFSATQKKTLEEWLAPLGLSADSVQNIIATGKSRAEALNEELAKLPYKDIPKVRKAVKASLAQRTLDNEVAKAKRDYESSEKKRAAKEQTVIETEARIKALETPLQQKDYLSTGSNTTLDQKINNLLSRVQALETQLRQKASSGLNAGANGGGNIPSVSGEPYHNALNQQAETADLERQGRAMIQRWIGTEAIVNKVRNGIRQAYQDIKSLDAAMTNIAVVTDMSIGDLWGKIDSYMSIAKQYGVTTQGVYEVSQLYYQQGLSTSEVMAATSETLKMARIAGMDYAEAADAMTVAIRAFKMEMSDAQIVTDVYSKVAAITASDSEELAIAMSKTASSAASVGSSFENTTAMLAVMVETTRESAQNLGSALKSIISRYGEMKTGVTVDADGEAIDYNKVDTALQSIGIALKDTQGQFRDFDDVIFELSEKWDTLDKNTQRYIATIMAGNRQQSRFIALVDNWERLDEVATAAQDSEDAGLLQYAKTLDSLETKLNNIKTSFQEFYMSIINGPVIGKVFETINSLFEGFNKQGSFAALLDVGSIVSSLTIIGNMFVSIFSGAFGQISANWKAMLQGLPADAAIAGQKAGNQYRNGATQPKGVGKLGTSLATAASFAGLALTTAGAAATQKYHNNVGAGISAVGNALSYGSMGFMLSGGNPIVTIVAGALGGITSAVASWRSDFELEQAKLEEATEKAEKANIKRAETKTSVNTLEQQLKQYNELQYARFDSEENQKKWEELNASMLESFPEIAATFDEAGNAIADLSAAEDVLTQRRIEAANAAREAADAQVAKAIQDKSTREAEYEDIFGVPTTASIIEDQYYTVTGTYDSFWGFGKLTANELAAMGVTHRATRSLSPQQELELLSKNIPAYSIISDGGGDLLGNRNTDLQKLKIRNKRLAEVGDFFNFDDQAVRAWYINLASENDFGNFIKNISNSFDSSYLAKGQTELELVQSLFGSEFKNFAEVLSKYNELTRGLEYSDIAIESANKSSLMRYIESSLLGGKEEHSYLDIQGAQSVLFEQLYDKLLGNGQTWETAKLNFANEFEEANKNYEQFYENLNIDLNDFNDLIANTEKGAYTQNDIKKQLEQYKLSTEQGQALGRTEEQIQAHNEIIQEYINKYTDDFDKSISRIAQSITSERREFNWNKIVESSEDWENFIKEAIPQRYIENLTAFANSIDAQLEGGVISSKQALDQVNNYTTAWATVSQLQNEEEKALAQQILGEGEWTTASGIRAMEAAFKEQGIQVDAINWASIIDSLAINLVTETASLQEKVAKNLDAAVKALNKAVSGIDSMEDLNKILDTYNLDYSDFNFSEGKWYIKTDSIEKYKEQLTKGINQDINDIQTKYGELAAAVVEEEPITANTDIEKVIKGFNDETSGAIRAAYTSYGKSYQEYLKQVPEREEAFTFSEYITQQGDNEAKALQTAYTQMQEYAEKQAIRTANLIEFANTIETRSDEEIYKDEAEVLLSNKGYKGYSKDDIAKIATAYGLEADDSWYTQETDGTFTLKKDAEFFKGIDTATANAINARVESDIKSAEEGLQKLGETTATGEELTPVEIRGLLGDQFKEISNLRAETLYSAFNRFDPSNASTRLGLQRAIALALAESEDISSEDAFAQAATIIGEIEAELTDAINNNFLKQIELQAKVLEGTASEVEKKSLLNAGINVSELETKTKDAIAGYINRFITNIDISFDNKVKNIKVGINTLMDASFGQDIGKMGETAAKGIFDSRDAAADFMSKYYTILGKTISADNVDVSQWFSQDASGQYRLEKEISTLLAELETAKTDANEQEINNLTKQLQYYDNLQKIQRKESLVSSLTSMVSSATEMATSSLMKMVSDAGGTEIKPEDAEKYVEELKDLDPLKRLQKTVSILSKYNVEIDASDYDKLVKSVVSSVMGSAQSAIQSAASGMSWDQAFELQKEIPGLKFEVIDGKLVTTEIEKVAEYYREQLENSIREQRQQLEAVAPQSAIGKTTVSSILGLRSEGLTDDEIISRWGGADFVKSALTLLNSDLFNLEDYQSWVANNADGTLNEYWEQYISTLTGEALEAGKKILEDLTEEANKQAEITSRAHVLKTEAEATMGKTYDRLAAEELIKSQGTTGYTEQQIAELEKAGIIGTDSAELDTKTGTWYLPPEVIQNIQDTSILNALGIKLQNESEAAKTAAKELASKIVYGNAQLSDYTAFFGENISATQIENYGKYIQEAVQGTISGRGMLSLKAGIKAELERKNPGQTFALNSPEVLERYNTLIRAGKDAANELTASVFDAKIQALSAGYLTGEARQLLTDIKDKDFIDQFEKAVSKSADERAKLIFQLYAETYDKYYSQGRITKAEQLSGIAEGATTYFSSLESAIKSTTQTYYTEAAEGIRSGDRAYSVDELGKLYAAARDIKGISEESFVSQYINTWNEAGEAILNIDKLKTDGIITTRQVAEFSNNLVNNVFSAAEDAINKMASGLGADIEVHEIQAIFDELGMSLDEERAKKIIDGGFNTLLNNLQLELMMAGADSGDISEKIKELQIMIIDMITEALASGFSALGEGIEGTLSEASYHELQKMYGLGNSSIRTSKGVQLSQFDQQALIRGLYGKAAASGRTAGFGEELWKTLSESEESSFKGYKDIQKEIETITKEMGEAEASTDGYVQALEAAKQAAMEVADAAEFAFMEQDGYDGKANTYDKFVENVKKAKEALTTFGKGGKLAHADLTNMFDVIKSSPEAIKGFETAMAKAGGNIDAIHQSMLKMAELGEIDIGEWATKMGIDIETATSAMAEGMSDALMATAKDQIKYLSGLEAMLEAMVALEAIGNIDLSLSFTGDDGQVISLQLSEILETWDQLSQTEQIELQAVIEQKFIGPNGIDYTAGAKSLTEALGFKGSLSTLLFGKEGIDGKQDLAIADTFGAFAENIRNMSEGEIETVALKMRAAMKDFMIFDDEGNITAWGEGYEGAFQKFLSGFDFTNIAESLNSKLSEALATKNGKITIPFEEGDLVIESAGADGLKITGPGGKMLTELSETQITAIKKSLAKQLGMSVEDIEIDTKTGLVNFYGEAAKAETEALKTEFTSISEAATGVSDAINKLQTLLSSFQISDSFRDFVGLMTQLITGSTGIAKTVEGAQNAANMEQLNAEVDGENERIITLKINIKEAEKSFAEIETAFNLLVTLLSTPITINVNSIGAISGAAISQTDGNTPPNTNPNGGVSSPLSSHTVQIIWDVQKPDFSQIKEPTIGFDWKQPATAPGPRALPTINFRWGSAINDPEYTGSAIKIPIEYVESITEDAEVVAWTGTMNDISGAAFADGSIGRLYSGAQLAGKTLVGELGPELAVYDGQYHLLGQHGAEFVNLPSDAIVFNHRQTEGIARGQFNIRGKAMAEGNITGPAMAGGAAEALAAVRRAKSLWQGLLDSLSAAELTSMGGGGGGGNNLKAIHEDLQEWYNLSRKIANIEQEINNIIAERQNIAAGDGGAYLRSLREEQALLQQQIANQEILQQYQEEQLKRQAEHINNNKIWSQFLQIGPDGLLQYINGNERFGGKGALEVLAQLNKMSAQEQINFITDLGYSYTDQNGKQLTGSDLVAKFFEELQLQIDQYDALYDAVHESSEALANLQNNINKINEEIRQNKIDLENSIYDVLVEAWEAEIEALEEQKELIEEANEAYIDGLNDALQAERDMYDQQQSVADRESLQRQLALLRRSGGSASEIADLERQLDDMLKQEYFDSQQKTIENIQDANEKQIKQLERQIQLQEEALTYQKENGVLWAKVAEIMDGSPESILAILQGNSSAFFAASTEQQAKMLEEWAMKVGIYTEDRIYQQHASFAKEKIWDSGDVWNEEGMGEFKDYYAGLDEKDRNTIRDVYTHAYANALLKGEKPEDARKAAAKAASDALKKKQEADKDKKNDDTDDTGDTSNPGGSTPTYSKIKIEISCSPPEGGTASASPNPCEPNTTVTVTPKANSGYKFTHITVGGQSKTGLSFTVTGNVNPVKVVAYFEPVDTSTSEEATAAAKTKVKQDPEATYIAKKYSKGGLVDYTGLAMVHGSPSKPEGFLNAEQTEIISQALTTVGDGGALDGIKRTLAALNANVQSIVNHVSNEVSSFTVAPGAVTIQVEELKDSYDIEKLSNDIMNRMVTIASKSTNRGINRR